MVKMTDTPEASPHGPSDVRFGETDLSSVDCRSCGACCIEAGAVDLTCHDDVPDDMVDEDALCFRWLKTEDGSNRCIALAGIVGRSVRCSIYAVRPATCSCFDRGDQACFAARARMRENLREAVPPPGYDERVD